VRDELPHSLAVVVDEMVPREGSGGGGRPPMLDVRVNLFVERDSQKAIIIGKGGERLRDVGTQARRGIEALPEEDEELKARCHYRSAKVDNVVYCLGDDVYVKVLVHRFHYLLYLP
jgi:GTPase Era involved in 16S rRNA processing